MAWSWKETAGILGLNVQGDLGPVTLYTSSRGKRVVYDQAPAHQPPSPAQTYMRQRFRSAATGWRLLTLAKQADWERATKLGHLKLTGYNLYTWWHMKRDDDAIATISRQTGVPIP